MKKIFVKPKDVAVLLDCSLRTAYSLIESGAIPSITLRGDRLLRVPLSALTKLADDAQSQQAAERTVEP
jgi:excisionase family DNA binding protein